MRVKFSDRQQADLTEMQALADSAEDNAFELTRSLLFSSDYRVEGGSVIEDAPASGVVSVEPGIFVKADGKFYRMATQATANILTGIENQPANVWGTGQAAHGSLPRKDIIVVSHQFVEDTSAVKNFINDTVTPPVQYTQNVTTRKQSKPIFSILHGTPDANPSEPAIPSGFMKLATVYVAPTVTVINTADITNNLNIDIKSLEKIQLASQAQSAFSDLLHSDGVYGGVLGEMEVIETSPQSMGATVSTGVALKDGVTARVSTDTTVPIDAASFTPKLDEVIAFSTDTQTLQCDGTPPHKIRSGTVVVTGVGGSPTYTEGADFSINYSAGTITRLAGLIPALGSVEVDYHYYLPRIDRVEVLMANSTPQVIAGTPAHTPTPPVPSPNAETLALVAIAEGVATVVNADITDSRIFLPDMDEIVTARAAYSALGLRLDDFTTGVAASTSHISSNITSSNTVHGIRQGTGNSLDADLLDGQHASYILARANHTGTQAPATISPQGDGSALDADAVDGIHASVTPTPSKLCPLDGSGFFPTSTIPPIGPVWVKSNVTFSMFLQSALTFDIPLPGFTLPIAGVVHMVKIKHSQGFAGGAIASYTLSVGIAGNFTKYSGTAYDVFQTSNPPGDTVYKLTSTNDGESHTATTSLRVQAVSAVGNLNVATQGVADIWILYSVAA